MQDIYDNSDSLPVLVIDGARYHRVSREEFPTGYCSVPIALRGDNEIKAQIIAGSIGMKLTRGKEELSGEKQVKVWHPSGLWRTCEAPSSGPLLDTIQPTSGWWIYETKTEEDILEEKRVIYESMRASNPDYYPEWKGHEESCANRVYWPREDGDW